MININTEDIVFRDVRRLLENSAVVSCDQCGAYTSVNNCTSTSSRPCNPSTSIGVNEESTSELNLPVNSQFTIVENNYSSGGINFILKGYNMFHLVFLYVIFL